jgi:hypothetical protein
MIILFSGMTNQNGFCSGNNQWKKDDIITIEINSNKFTYHLFINNILEPISLLNIPFPLKGEV